MRRNSVPPSREPQLQTAAVGKLSSRRPIRIGVQILNHNGRQWLEELLPTLREHHDPDSIVYLLDNSSEDDSVAFFRREMSHGRVIQLGTNCGYSPAYNVAAPIAWADDCEWLCLLNNDTRVSQDWLAAVRRLHVEDPRIGVIGPAFRDWKGTGPNTFFQRRHPQVSAKLGSADVIDVDWVEGSAMFIRRDCWHTIGAFDPNYFIFWDETEYCRRARLNGWRVVVACDSVVEHYGGGSVSSESAFRKPLMQLNCYAYRLTDPGERFATNIGRWLRLLVTESRQVARSKNRIKTLILWWPNVAKTFIAIPSLYRRYRSYCAGSRMSRTDGRFAETFTDLSLRERR